MIKKINALKARQQLGELLQRERAGKPMAAVALLSQLEEWQERHTAFLAKVEALWDKNQDTAPETIERDVDETVLAARNAPSRRKA